MLPEKQLVEDVHHEVLSDLRKHQILRAAAVKAQHKADGLEELLNTGSELLLLHAAGSPRVQDPRLHNELKQVLQSLIQR